MIHFTQRCALSLILLGGPLLAVAQGAPETPRPQDLEPGVNTSAPAQAPARETPRPQDLEPGVNTSATPPADVATPAAPAPAPKVNLKVRTPPAGAPTVPTTTAKPAVGPDGKPVKGKSLDRLELDTTQITGNRELPKVLYIVPWKRADLGDLVGKPVNSLLDEVLAPVDRDVFKRENRYYRAVTPEGEPGAPAAGAASDAGARSGGAAPATRDEK